MNYTPTIWENGKKPAINATHLNKMENELARLANIVSVPDITEITSPTMPNSYDGRLLVKEIGGVCEQDSTAGNQLFDGLLEQGTYDGDGNKSASNHRVRNANSVVVSPNETYTISASVVKNIALYELDANGKRIATLSSWGTLPLTFTVSNSASFIAFALRIDDTNAVSPSMVKDVMLNKGTTALPYEPYTGGIPSPNPSYPQEIKKTVVSEIKTHGKNFIDFKEAKSDSENEITISDNGITIKSLTSVWYNYYKYFRKQLKPNTSYTLSADVQSSSNSPNRIISINNSSGGVIRNSNRLASDGHLTVTFTSPSDGIVILGFGTNYEGAVTISYYNIMLNEGDTALPYEYSFSSITLSQPIDLYGIGDVQNVIMQKESGRKFGVKVFNGSEGWGIDSASGRMYTFAYQGKWKGSPSNDAVADALCSHYKVKTPNDTYNKKEGFAVSTDGGITIYDARFSDVESFKAWLAQNPITIVCRLATPTEEDLPLADQIALNSLSTYDGITYLEFDSEIKPTFKGEYGTSRVGGYTLEALLTARSK